MFIYFLSISLLVFFLYRKKKKNQIVVFAAHIPVGVIGLSERKLWHQPKWAPTSVNAFGKLLKFGSFFSDMQVKKTPKKWTP